MAMANSIRSSIMPMESSMQNSDHISVEDMKLKSNYVDEKEGDHVMHVKQEDNSRNQPASSMVKDLASLKHEDQLRSTKAQIVEVREENERLKQLLSKIVKDYESLQKHFSKVVKEEEEKKSTKIKSIHQENGKPELISLSLGRSSSEPRKEEKMSSNLSGENEELNNNNKGLLSLGLNIKFKADSSVTMNKNNNNNNNLSSESNSFGEEQEPKEEDPTETLPPSKVLKTTISADDEVLQQTQMKKTRVSVRTRCEAPTMNDGCQWRKYGQKIAKGNPCPRAYYRCTASPTCPVRKQVQRCAEEMSILITTYEGTHNHPLPLSATAMASTTSAAASMLQSHSSTSQPGTSSSISAPSSISNIQNFTFSTQNNHTLIKSPNQFYFPNSSISTNNSHPTITLDLTTPVTNKSTKCFNFSSSSLDSNSTFQSPWTHPTGHPTYNRYNNNGTYMTDQTIAAATKVIALDPNFRSALAAAITSIVGNNNNTNNYNNNPGGNLGDHHQSLTFNYPTSSQSGIINGCGSSYLLNNKSAPNNTNNLRSQQQQGSLVLFPPPLQPFSPSNTSSGSPANSRDHNKSS